MTRVLSIGHRFVNFRSFLFNDTASFLCLLFLFFNPNDTVSIFGFFYNFFINAAVFFSFFSCFLFSTLTRVNLREERGYGTSSDDGSDYWVIKNLGGAG